MPEKTYNLVDYTDVWGNTEDGWEVNNLSRTEEFITITDDATDDEIFEYLRDTIGYFLKDTKAEEVRFEWADDFICEFYATETEMPLGRLELEIR